jgi:tetratricopeptide (TPR) repeat protein
VAPKLNKRRAVAAYEQARLFAEKGEWARVEASAREVAYDSQLDAPEPYALLAEALVRQGRRPDAVRALEDGLRAHPKHPELEARLGAALLQEGLLERAVELLGSARTKLKRDPALLTHYATALLRVGRTEDAERQLAAALLLGGGLETKLALALVKGRRGQFEEAEGLARQVEEQAPDDAVRSAARTARAECRLMLGDAKGALELFRSIRDGGTLEPDQLGRMAWAAQQAGESALADELIAARRASAGQGSGGGPSAEDFLLFARIAMLRSRPEEALAHLDAAERAPGEQYPGWRFECLSARGRALRMLSRREEARRVLDEALALPESSVPRIGAPVHVDLGHLAAEAGDFEGALASFDRALALAPGDPEAQRARELSHKRVAWREELKASAEAQVQAAKAEAEAQRRRFLSREGELEALRRELAELKARQASTAESARRAEETARAEQQQRLREELLAREREVEEKARAVLEGSFGDARARCPQAVWQMLEVAERTFQKAMYTELPAAAVAVLFSGALERSLIALIVSPFDAWLEKAGRREDFLKGAVREKKGKRVEYFDNVIESFDRSLKAKAPGLGEIGRVLERRHEAYLEPFSTFLASSFDVPDAFWTALAELVAFCKERLRDPVAHGRAIELGYPELTRFRTRLVLEFEGKQTGALPQLVGASRNL